MKDYRPVNFARLTFGITENRNVKKQPIKYKKVFDTSVVGSNIEEVLKYKPGFENSFHLRFGLTSKTAIKLINLKILHNQGKTTYKI